MDKIEIFYFSGTGNSLHVARELRKKLPSAVLIPIASFIGKNELKTSGKVIGFVFPIHLSTIPIFILDFIRQIDLSSAEYIFAVATRVGTEHSAFFEMEKILKKKNKKLNAFISLNMPSNDPKFGFKALMPEEMAKLDKQFNRRLDILAGAISVKTELREKDNAFTARVPLVNALAWLVKLADNMQQKFYADEKCAGCGTCAKVCLSKKIIMKDGRPFWQKEVKCFKCYACLNFCPNKAVQIKGYTENKGRYSHPFASIEDIARQKYE